MLSLFILPICCIYAVIIIDNFKQIQQESHIVSNSTIETAEHYVKSVQS